MLICIIAQCTNLGEFRAIEIEIQSATSGPPKNRWVTTEGDRYDDRKRNRDPHYGRGAGRG